MLDLAIPRIKGVALAETGAAGLDFAKSSTHVLNLAILRIEGVLLAETGAAIPRVKGGGAGRDGCSRAWFCQIGHLHALSGKIEDEEGGDGRGPVVIAHAAVVVVAMHVAMAVAVW